ncbi:MAG: type IV secretion system protein [Dialister invisus]|uniref:type IV secretion system protein n=1 Tax=Dialister invisus TaxID=218538 RepID=UPI002F95DF05
MMNLAGKQKKILLGLSLLLAVTAASSKALAVYPVHDSRVYAQIVQQIKKATEQINHLKQQINNQIQNLQNLKRDNIDPVLNEIAVINNEYNNVKKSMNSLISGVISAKDAYKQNFQDLTKLDYRNTTFASINSKINANREKLEESNIQITEMINKNQEKLAASQELIKKTTAEIANAKGAKDLAQLQNILQAETINSQNITNEITALQAKQQAIKATGEKLEKDGGKAIMEKASSDFSNAAEDMLSTAKAQKGIKTQTPTLYREFEKVGWR